MKRWSGSIALVMSLSLLSGCFASHTRVGGEDRIPERQLFKAVSAYYCAHKRWPVSLLELSGSVVGSQDGVGDVESVEEAGSGRRYLDEDVLQYFSNASVSAPRPITFSVEYQPPVVSAPSLSAPSGRRRATFIAPPSCGEAVAPGSVSIAAGRVIFAVSPGFAPLATSDLKERWGNGVRPDVAWSEPKSRITIAVRFGEAELTVQGMPRFKAGLEAAYTRSVPGLGWIRKELAAAHTPPMLIHEFESNSLKGRQRTVAYSLSFDKSLLSITVSGDALVGSQVDDAAKLVRDTLQIK